MAANKIPHTRTSFTLTEDMKSKITQISKSNHIPVAKLVRLFIEKGMNVEKTQSDIDFIRFQLNEEMDSLLKRHEKEIGEMILDIALYVVPLCIFTSEVTQMLMEKRQGMDLDDMLEQAQKETLAILSNYENVTD